MATLFGPPSFSLYYKVLAALGVALCCTLLIAPPDAQIHLVIMLVMTAVLGVCIRL
jgi:hypothetical protein